MFVKLLRWFWFGVLLSILPFILVLLFYMILDYDITAIEFVPDLILVSFAVAVNLGSLSQWDATKNKNLHAACSVFSYLSMLLCFAGYFILVGRALEMNAEFLKVEEMIKMNPDSVEEVLSKIETFQEQRIKGVQWNFFIIGACVIALINAVLGFIIEGMESKKPKVESVR